MTKSLVQSGYLSPQIVADKASQVAEGLEYLGRGPSLSKLQSAAALATLGHIKQVERLDLYNLDTSSVPAEELSSLVKCSDVVGIARVNGGLAPVLSSVQCGRLHIHSTSLSTADTQQLVAAMDTRVKWVTLCGSVTLDMETLTQYDGEGVCGEVKMNGISILRYGNQVKKWAENMGWKIEEKSDASGLITKIRIKRLLFF